MGKLLFFLMALISLSICDRSIVVYCGPCRTFSSNLECFSIKGNEDEFNGQEKEILANSIVGTCSSNGVTPGNTYNIDFFCDTQCEKGCEMSITNVGNVCS